MVKAVHTSGRVAVITGASRGIGGALALACARRGMHLALVARSADDLATVAGECTRINPQAQAHIIPADLATEPGRIHAIAHTLAHFGRIDLLIANAGIVRGGAFMDIPFDDIQRQVAFNLLGSMHLVHLALPAMLAQGTGQVVLMSSFMGRHALPYMTGYVAGKFGIAGFGEALRRDLAGTGVRVLTVFPGFVDTGMVSAENRALLRPYGVRVITPERVARRVLRAASRGRVSVSIGGVEHAAVWAGRLFPRLADFLWHRLTPPEYREAAKRNQTR